MLKNMASDGRIGTPGAMNDSFFLKHSRQCVLWWHLCYQGWWNIFGHAQVFFASAYLFWGWRRMHSSAAATVPSATRRRSTAQGWPSDSAPPANTSIIQVISSVTPRAPTYRIAHWAVCWFGCTSSPGKPSLKIHNGSYSSVESQMLFAQDLIETCNWICLAIFFSISLCISSGHQSHCAGDKHEQITKHLKLHGSCHHDTQGAN